MVVTDGAVKQSNVKGSNIKGSKVNYSVVRSSRAYGADDYEAVHAIPQN